MEALNIKYSILGSLRQKTHILRKWVSEIAKVEADEVLKIKELTFVNDCFQHETNEEISVFWRTLSKFIKRLAVILLLLITSIHAFPNIIVAGGVVNENTIWTSNDTVIVFADLIVPESITLIIEGGAYVKLNINTGIVINGGSLLALGTPQDSVLFVPNYSVPGLTWKWKGIIINDANIEAQSKIVYADIINVETGIRLEDCYSVEIQSVSIANCQNIGLQLVNSSSCNIVDCKLENNYDGIEIIAPFLGSSSNNIIYNCILRNENNNIYISRETGSNFTNNLISGNIIESGINGIWAENTGGSVSSQNIFENNIFINNGFDIGYALFLEFDSTIVRNNIFWENNIALFSASGASNCQFANNSFYQNYWAIAIGPGAAGNNYINNTFTLNKTEIFGIKETNGIVFSANNILHTDKLENIVVNNTAFDLFIDDNYWGTTDTSLINKMIYDKKDNPSLGTLVYIPFLDTLKVVNPMSPPYKVIKQIIDNKLKVTWLPNAEMDLAGYIIYYDNFIDYSFSENYDIGLDTTFIFSDDISVYSNIAVTAYDSTIVTVNAQVSGHESPFSFAVLYPYAGPDTIICTQLKELEIVYSNVPMAYNNLFWTTSGDGLFNNSSIQSPIYFPGSLDVENGGAILSLYVVVSTDTLIDRFNLSIIDDPIAFAGNDTTVIADTEIFLTEAMAENYDNILWFTSGDGVFNNDTLVEPNYYPGSIDTQSGVVYLEMVVYSQCGFTSDTIKVNIEPYFSVEGRVWANSQIVDIGVVVAFKKNSEGARASQFENTQSDGSFKFEKLMTGNYYIYALPDTNNIDFAVPGYYANKLKWQRSYLLPVDANVYDIDIYLPSIDYVLPIGEASISGHMNMPPNSKYNNDIYCAPWFDNKSDDFCVGGLSNISVFLFNESQSVLLDYTLTNQFGDFYFKEIPYGNYVVDAEKAGFVTVASSIISLSQDHKNETDVILEISQQKIGIHFEGETNDNITTNVFPNPASNEINIPITNLSSNPSHLEIYDVVGNQILTFNLPIDGYSSYLKVNISHLISGIYFGYIVSANSIKHFRFVKK